MFFPPLPGAWRAGTYEAVAAALFTVLHSSFEEINLCFTPSKYRAFTGEAFTISENRLKRRQSDSRHVRFKCNVVPFQQS